MAQTMQRSGVCLSILCPSAPSFAGRTPLLRVCWAGARPVGRRYRPIAAQPALSSSGALPQRLATNAGSALLTADVGSLLNADLVWRVTVSD